MNPDKMTPDQMMEFVRQQNYTFKVELTGEALEAYFKEFREFQEAAAEEILQASEYQEANEVIARIKAKL